MTACELIAFLILTLFASFHGINQWMFMRRQQDQIRQLQRYLAVADPDAAPYLQNTVANDQNLERASLQNQQKQQKATHLPPITG